MAAAQADEAREVENVSGGPDRERQSSANQPTQMPFASPQFQPGTGKQEVPQINHVSVRRLRDSKQRTNLMEKTQHVEAVSHEDFNNGLNQPNVYMLQTDNTYIEYEQ